MILKLASAGVDLVQEKLLHKGPQDNESAFEQAKDEKISDFVRDKYKSTTGAYPTYSLVIPFHCVTGLMVYVLACIGHDFPIKDKPTRFD